MNRKSNGTLYYRSLPKIPNAEGKYLIDTATLTDSKDGLLITVIGMEPYGRFMSLLIDKMPLVDFVQELDKYVLATIDHGNSHYLKYKYRDVHVLQRFLASCYVPEGVYRIIIKENARFKDYIFTVRLVKSWFLLYQVTATNNVRAKEVPKDKQILAYGKLVYGDGRLYCQDCPFISECVYEDTGLCRFPIVRNYHRIAEICDETFKDLLLAMVELNIKTLDHVFDLDKNVKYK